MENPLHILVSADAAARKSVEEANARRDALSAELAESRRALEAQYQQSAEKAIEKAGQNLQAQADAAAKAARARTEAQAARLQALYDEHADEWVKTITNAICGA